VVEQNVHCCPPKYFVKRKATKPKKNFIYCLYPARTVSENASTSGHKFRYFLRRIKQSIEHLNNVVLARRSLRCCRRDDADPVTTKADITCSPAQKISSTHWREYHGQLPRCKEFVQGFVSAQPAVHTQLGVIRVTAYSTVRRTAAIISQ
jgi:hypothetical protein